MGETWPCLWDMASQTLGGSGDAQSVGDTRSLTLGAPSLMEETQSLALGAPSLMEETWSLALGAPSLMEETVPDSGSSQSDGGDSP